MKMSQKQIEDRLKAILNRADVGLEQPINRKISPKHTCKIEVLLEHVSLMVADLRLDLEATKRELFTVRKILEEEKGCG